MTDPVTNPPTPPVAAPIAGEQPVDLFAAVETLQTQVAALQAAVATMQGSNPAPVQAAVFTEAYELLITQWAAVWNELFAMNAAFQNIVVTDSDVAVTTSATLAHT